MLRGQVGFLLYFLKVEQMDVAKLDLIAGVKVVAGNSALVDPGAVGAAVVQE